MCKGAVWPHTPTSSPGSHCPGSHPAGRPAACVSLSGGHHPPGREFSAEAGLRGQLSSLGTKHPPAPPGAHRRCGALEGSFLFSWIKLPAQNPVRLCLHASRGLGSLPGGKANPPSCRLSFPASSSEQRLWLPAGRLHCTLDSVPCILRWVPRLACPHPTPASWCLLVPMLPPHGFLGFPPEKRGL